MKLFVVSVSTTVAPFISLTCNYKLIVLSTGFVDVAQSGVSKIALVVS